MGIVWPALDRNRHVLSSITEKELAILEEGLEDKAAATDEIIRDVVAMVRANIAACSVNRLGVDGTLPPSLIGTASDLVVFRLMKRAGYRAIPQIRQDANTEALKLLERVGNCKLSIEAPTVEGDSAAQPRTVNTVVTNANNPVRQTGQANLKGLL